MAGVQVGDILKGTYVETADIYVFLKLRYSGYTHSILHPAIRLNQSKKTVR